MQEGAGWLSALPASAQGRDGLGPGDAVLRQAPPGLKAPQRPLCSGAKDAVRCQREALQAKKLLQAGHVAAPGALPQQAGKAAASPAFAQGGEGVFPGDAVYSQAMGLLILADC